MNKKENTRKKDMFFLVNIKSRIDEKKGKKK